MFCTSVFVQDEPVCNYVYDVLPVRTSAFENIRPHERNGTHRRQLKNKGTLEHAQTIANHASPRTTKLYDRRSDEISLDEVEKIVI